MLLSSIDAFSFWCIYFLFPRSFNTAVLILAVTLYHLNQEPLVSRLLSEKPHNSNVIVAEGLVVAWLRLLVLYWYFLFST